MVAAFVRPACLVPPTGPVTLAHLGTSRTHGAHPLIGADGVTVVAFYYENGGWRAAEYSALTAAGCAPDFVGTHLNSTDGVSNAGTAHDGINGSAAAGWVGSYFPGIVASISQPAVTLVEIGTNDQDSAAGALACIALADAIAAAWPKTRVIWTTPLRRSGTNDYVTQSARTRTEVTARIAAGQNLVLADANQLSIPAKNFPDTLHLDNAGDAVMSRFLIPYVLRAVGA